MAEAGKAGYCPSIHLTLGCAASRHLCRFLQLAIDLPAAPVASMATGCAANCPDNFVSPFMNNTGSSLESICIFLVGRDA